MKFCSTRVSLAFIHLALFSAISLHAQLATPLESSQNEDDYDHFSFRAGAFLLSSINTKIRLSDSGGSIGDDLDFKKDLGGEDSLNLFRADAEWRFGRRHKLQLSYFNINQSGSKVLSREIEWGGEVYPINLKVKSEFDTTVTRLNYGYTFFRNDTHEVTVLIGAHITQLDTSISGDSGNRKEGLSVTAPLPVFGLEWKAYLSERFTTQVSYEYFGITYDDNYKGRLSTFQALLSYKLTDYLSVGCGFERYTIGASVESKNLKLSVNHSYNGFMAYLGTSF